MPQMPLDTKGKRPSFFSDPAHDAIMTALLEVMAENWALKERLYALERLLTQSGAIKPDAIETLSWNDEDKAAHEAERQRILTDAFRALKSEFVGRAARQNDIDA